jgi:hypothetical protein
MLDSDVRTRVQVKLDDLRVNVDVPGQGGPVNVQVGPVSITVPTSKPNSSSVGSSPNVSETRPPVSHALWLLCELHVPHGHPVTVRPGPGNEALASFRK